MKLRALLVACLGLLLTGQDYNVPFRPQEPAGGGECGTTDFTADASAEGVWLLYSDGIESGAVADRSGNARTLATGGSHTYTATPPAGTVSGQDAVTLDGTDGFVLADVDAPFQAANFTILVWVKPGSDSNLAYFSKNDVTAWELMYRYGTDNTRAEVENVEQLTTTTQTTADWLFVGLRYDGTGTSSDAADDTIEVFTNGVIDCESCATSADPTGNTDDVCVGGNQSCATPFPGDMMEAGYFSRVLSDAEMAEIFLCGMDGSADGSARDTAFGGATCASIGGC